MTKFVAVLACVLATAVLAAQGAEVETSSCLGLQTQLATLEEQLAQHRAQEGKCQKESEELGSKLRDSANVVESLQTKLAEAEKEVSELKLSAESAVDAKAQAEAAEARVADAQVQLSAALDAKRASEAALIEAQEALSKAQDASAALEALRSLHEGAWLPHWLAVRSRSALEAVGPAFKAGQELAIKYSGESGKRVHEFWTAHVNPSLEKVYTASKAASEKYGGEWVPKIQAAAASAVAKAKALLESEHVVKLKALWRKAVRHTVSTSRQVVSELESALITLLKKSPNLVPLARKPYVTYFAYIILGAPVLALGLPLLGKLVFGGGSQERSEALGVVRGSKAAARRAKRRA